MAAELTMEDDRGLGLGTMFCRVGGASRLRDAQPTYGACRPPNPLRMSQTVEGSDVGYVFNVPRKWNLFLGTLKTYPTSESVGEGRVRGLV